MGILGNFLTKKILVNFLGITFVISIIFFGNQSIIVLKEGLKIGLLSSEIIPFISLKILRDLPEILIISFLLSILLTFSRLNRSSEKVILLTSGLNDISLFRITLRILFPLVFIVSILIFFLTPWSKSEIYQFKEVSKNRPAYIFLKEKAFQDFGKNIFYASSVENIDDLSQELNNIFLISNSDNKKNLIISRKGLKTHNAQTSEVFLELYDGRIYQDFNINLSSYTEFEKYKLKIYSPVKEKDSEENIVNEMLDFFSLLKEDTKDKYSEIIYRVSLPMMLIFLTFYNILVTEANSREAKNYSFLKGLLLFFIYFNAILFFRSQTYNDLLDFIFAFFIVHVSFGGIIWILFLKKNFTIKF